MLIQVVHQAIGVRRLLLRSDLYRNSLVVRPGDANKWWLMDVTGFGTKAARMRRISRGSIYYQLQPLQRNTTTWEIGCPSDGDNRFFRLEVNSPPTAPRSVYVEVTPMAAVCYPNTTRPAIAFEINGFDFRTRITSEDGNEVQEEPTKPELKIVARRLSRYERPPVI